MKQTLHCDLDTSVPDWVIDHPETLIVFQKLGIEYCCGGKSLRYACQEQGLDEDAVMSRLMGCLDVQTTPNSNDGRHSQSLPSHPVTDAGQGNSCK